ncbi:hypothetical protein ACROYT_G037678 [Oculina patagonica]
MFVAEGEKVPDDLYDQQDSFHRGGTINDITDQICSLNANLHSYDSPTQLVVDKYMKEHGLEVEPDEEEFGYGKLLIDYKPPKKSTSKISNKGELLTFVFLQWHSIPDLRIGQTVTQVDAS